MIIFGLFILVLLVCGGTYAAVEVVRAVREVSRAGTLTATPKTGTKTDRAKVTARNAPHNVRTIFAQAYADNWVAKKAHQRTAKAGAAPAAPRPSRRPLLQRLVAPGQPDAFGGAPAQAATTTASANGRKPQTVTATVAPAAASPRPPATPAKPHLTAVPSPTSGRNQPMTQAPTAPSPTGAAADMFSSASALASHAKAGGIHAKSRALKVFGEAFEALDATLRSLAQDMAEQGEYPAGVWEPVMTAAAHAKATSLALGEADASLTSLMNMNIGELAASPVRAPRNQELNRA